jgi:hypothetical protein
LKSDIQASVDTLLARARAILPPEAMALIDTHVRGLVAKPRPRLPGGEIDAMLAMPAMPVSGAPEAAAPRQAAPSTLRPAGALPP